MAKRRANNEGSLFKDQRGYWIGEIVMPGGKKKRKASKRQSVVKEWLQTSLNQLREGTYLEDTKLTVSELFGRFMADVGSQTLRPKTIELYTHQINKHINPTLGHIKLRDLKPYHLQSLYTQKLNEGLSKRSVQSLHALLRRVLNQAVLWELIPRNPTSGVVAPKPEKKELELLSLEQIKVFLNAVAAHRYFPIYAIAVGCGLREGEVLALRKKDVDIESGVLWVRQTVVSINGYLSFGEPKSENSKRPVAMPEFVLSAVAPYYEACRETDELLFHTSTGRPISPRNVLRHFHTELTKLGYPKVHFHSLRHSFVSYLSSMNVPPKDIQAIVGHSTISTTLSIYAHVFDNAKQEAAKKINTLFE